MTKMDGITATRLIKEEHPQIAVIGLSVDEQHDQRYAMQKVEALEVIVKENELTELHDAIQRAVAFTR